MLKREFGIDDITLQPSSGGVFDVALNHRLVFSKHKEGRFPNAGEVENTLATLIR